MQGERSARNGVKGGCSIIRSTCRSDMRQKGAGLAPCPMKVRGLHLAGAGPIPAKLHTANTLGGIHEHKVGWLNIWIYGGEV